ncbi:hypothetical protein ACKFKF_10595 [Phormidesmis sp. 146-12]
MTSDDSYLDPYESILFNSYTETEIEEIESLVTAWDKATYPTVAASIVRHANKHGFQNDYLRYLRKAASFNKKGARKKDLPDRAVRWNKGNQF